MNLTAYRALLGDPIYRRFWLGGTVSVLGDSLTRVAFTWFVYQKTGSAGALAWLMIATTAPIVLGGFLAGWALDRFPRRGVMILDNLARGAAVALVPLLYSLGRLELWHIYALAAVYGLLMMISLAGTPSLIPDLARREHLSAANALETLSYTVGSILGPALGGLLVAAIGAPMTVLVDVASYLVFALALAGIPQRSANRANGARASVRMIEALRLVLGQPVLIATTLMFFAFNLGLGGLNVWLPVLTRTHLAGGAQLYGILLSLMAAGETLSSVVAGSWRDQSRLGRAIALAQALSGLSVVAILLAPGAVCTGLGRAALGFCSAPLTIWTQTLRMRVIPEPLRGRSFALLRLVMQGGNPLGAAGAGLALGLLGLAPAIALSALLIGGPGLIGLTLPALRSGRSDPA